MCYAEKPCETILCHTASSLWISVIIAVIAVIALGNKMNWWHVRLSSTQTNNQDNGIANHKFLMEQNEQIAIRLNDMDGVNTSIFQIPQTEFDKAIAQRQNEVNNFRIPQAKFNKVIAQLQNEINNIRISQAEFDKSIAQRQNEVNNFRIPQAEFDKAIADRKSLETTANDFRSRCTQQSLRQRGLQPAKPSDA